MRIIKSGRQSFNVTSILWTITLSFSLALGVRCDSEELIRDEKSMFSEVQAYTSPDTRETFNVLHILREVQALYEQQLLQQLKLKEKVTQNLQSYADGDVSESTMEFEHLSSPMALQGRTSFFDETSKEEAKRGNYMALCHFKICNMGRKRNNIRWMQRYKK